MPLLNEMTFREFGETYLKVQPRTGPPTLFYFKPAQVKLDTEKGQETIVLKARRNGTSRYCHNEAIYEAAKRAERGDAPLKFLSIFHRDDTVVGELRRTATAIRSLPPHVVRHAGMGIERQSDDELVLANGAHFWCGCARSSDLGPGEDINFLHCSEIPKWVKWGSPAEKVALLVPSLTDDAIGRYESTPHGRDDYFYETWQEPAGVVRVFLPWLLVPEYRAGSPERWEDLEAGDGLWPAEAAMRERGIEADRVRWRRMMIRKLWKKDFRPNGIGELIFRREYPEDDASCFTEISGIPAFAPEKVAAMLETCPKGQRVWSIAELRAAKEAKAA